MAKSGIPKRWKNYNSVGSRVRGTRFLPFKVPLGMDILQRHPEDCWFTPENLVEAHVEVKAVIDLTEVDPGRYYCPLELQSRGVRYAKLPTPGGRLVPKAKIVKRFFSIVEDLLNNLDDDALIGVHCTHGLNRTGYLICKYMVERLKIDPQEAIFRFEEARGHKMERPTFVNDIYRRMEEIPKLPSSASSSVPSSVPLRRSSWGKPRFKPDGLNWRRRDEDRSRKIK